MATGDLVIKIGEYAESNESISGTTQVVLDDVELQGERDNSIKHGITGTDPKRILDGNETYSLSVEAGTVPVFGDLLSAAYDGDATVQSGYFKAEGVVEITFDTLSWNSFSMNKSEDDAEATLSLDADLAGVDVNSL